MTRTSRIVKGAVAAGVASFIVIYVSLALGLVFALSLLPENTARWIENGFKLFGLLALLFPGYVAARIAGRNGVLHGLLTGVGISLVSAIFLTLTFSWEGTYREAIWFAILKITAIGLLGGCLGGLYGDWRNRQGRG